MALLSCTGYDSACIHDAVQRSVGLLGGMGQFIKPGDSVLIKPNMLKAMPPEAAVTTHPEVVRSVIKLVRTAGGDPIVGDSPGMGDVRKVAEKCGILAVLRDHDVPLVDLDEAVQVRGKGRFQHFEIARRAIEADAIINLPKLKTHGMTTLTGAVKNLFGCIPGRRKVQWHFNTGVNHEHFMQMLLDLYMLLRPKLTIMDAVVGMEGNGPGSGDPRMIGAIIVGQDAVSVDVVAGRLVGVGTDRLPIARIAAASGIGETDIDRIHVVGDDPAGFYIKNFRLPPREHTEWRLPEWARRSMKNALTTRPSVDHGACVKCGICWSHCPQKAITHEAGNLRINYRVCIRCYCCQEFCPQGAITVGKGWALKLLP